MKSAPVRLRTHKLFAPRTDPGSVRRDSILSRIAAAPAARVVFLQAPAGHGKSTTLAQIRDHRQAAGQLCGWLTLEEADDEPRRLVLYLQAMLEGLMPDTASFRPSRPPLRPRSRTSWVLDQLLALDRDISLFIDEFQHIGNPELLDFFGELFMALPPQVTLFVGTRSLAETGLAQLKVSGRALFVDAVELRFDPAEVATFFGQRSSVELTPEDLDQVYRRTEGWPAALQLISLSLRSFDLHQSLAAAQPFRPRELAEYLAETVTNLQPAPVQDFLRRTSLLDRLSVELCDTILERDDSAQMLDHLERAGLFLRSLDAERTWFRYHSLFAECLQEQLAELAPEAVTEVHRRAADWHRRNGNRDQALSHLLAIQDVAQAAEVLDDWASDLVARGQLLTVMRWAGRLPLDAILARASLCIKYAWTCTFLRRADLLAQLLPALEARVGQGDIANTTDPAIVLSMIAVGGDHVGRSFEWVSSIDVQRPDVTGFAAFELGAAANLAAYYWLATGDMEMAREQVAVAQDFNTRGDLSFSYGYTISIKAILMIIEGQLREALRLLELALQDTPMHRKESVASAAVVSAYVWAAYESGRNDLAIQLFDQHRAQIVASDLPDFLAVAMISAARIHALRGDVAAAEGLHDEFALLARANGWPRLLQLLAWERVRMALNAGDIERARAVARVCEPLRTDRHIRTFVDYLSSMNLHSIALSVACGDEAGAAQQLHEEQGARRGTILRNIRLQLMHSQLFLLRGDRNAASRHLRMAMQLAAPGGYVQRFVDSGAGVLALLDDFHRRSQQAGESEQSPEVENLLAAALASGGGGAPRSAIPSQGLPQPLTERERELLTLLAAGMPNKLIARRVFVSENTVKFHLKNVYGKLGVRTRVQAIAEGRRLGLIADV